ncbi:uncharacterized protein LOC128758983 isoform X2 [Synchiropus splendidus]|uniref:uncharacterized protein LOC128758983 isoform X2 n=1 Tax=Synchiropus splendidus TaxID=270530 RepID=UPI00237EC9E1|nr:uncharacterized protein LOC128758983 isoform X2 [Synchiropus splendidus]
MEPVRKRKFSPVWDYFELTGNNKVKCVLCSKELGYNDNTSSMLRHFRALHESKEPHRSGVSLGASGNVVMEDPQPFYFVEQKELKNNIQTEPSTEEDLVKQQDHDYEELHCSLPVISTALSKSGSTGPDESRVSPKYKRQASEARASDAPTSIRDDDELFLLSLLPSLKRLTIKKRMEVRMKFQQVLYAAEFEN